MFFNNEFKYNIIGKAIYRSQNNNLKRDKNKILEKL